MVLGKGEQITRFVK